MYYPVLISFNNYYLTVKATTFIECIGMSNDLYSRTTSRFLAIGDTYEYSSFGSKFILAPAVFKFAKSGLDSIKLNTLECLRDYKLMKQFVALKNQSTELQEETVTRKIDKIYY